MTTDKPTPATKIIHEEQPSWQKLDEAEAFRRANADRRRQQGYAPSQPSPSLIMEPPTECIGTQRLTQGRLPPDPRITVSVAVRNTPKELLERAVKSILDQTYQNVIVVVTADGEDSPSWERCRFIHDSRVVCTTSKLRKGPYFAHEAARRAFPSPLFAVQDADDWSDLKRFERLAVAIQAYEVDVAYPSVVEYPLKGTATTHRPGTTLNHYWLIRNDAVNALGGYYAGVMVGMDVFLAKLVRVFGMAVPVPEAFYHCRAREGSLSHDPTTGPGSEQRVSAESALEEKYAALADGGMEGLVRYADRPDEPYFVEHLATLRAMQ